MAAYDALSLAQATQLYLLVGMLGMLVYLLLLLSFFLVPNIKAQHPAANLVVWHAGCGFLASLGFVAAYAAGPDASHCVFLAPYTQFFLLAGGAWYLMLALDLLVALVNPWMGYSCKSWAYHIIGSALSALLLYQQRLFGLSPLNICWLQRTEDPLAVNGANWLFLFGGVVGICVLSLGVLLFASFRFVRRQLDVTYRTKRRNLLQYYRYLLIFAGNWATCGALYYAAYRQQFHGRMAKHFELALALVFGSYPVLLLVVWVVNTELYQNRSSENSLSKFEREAEGSSSTEHFSAALRKDLMRYTTAGIRCSISESPADSLRSPLLSLTRDRFSPVDRIAALSFLQLEEGDSAGLYHEKKRLATTVYNGEYRYYEKLGFTDYAPKVFQNIRELCGIDNDMYEQSFADTLLERASEGKSGMLFYFSSDRKYLVKTMTKKEHSFLLEVLPLYHQYVLKQPNSLLCRFLGCHSMQLPVGWNKMFFVVMENVFSDGPVDERYDLKGIFHQSNFRYQEGVPTPVSSEWSQRGGDERSGKDEEGMEQVEEDDAASSENQSVEAEIRYVTETQPLLQRGSSRPSLRYDNDFVTRRASLRVTPTTRANLLAQVTSDCGFLQELGIMDYSCLLGIRHYSQRIEPEILDNLAHNAVVSANQSTVYYLGFVDILQHYNIGWKMQHCLLAAVVDKRKITALPPAEYALRFLNFIHEYLLRDPEGSNIRSYGSVGYTPPASSIGRQTDSHRLSRDRRGVQRAMDGELQRTLSELCTDLFSVAALEDCNAILQSLALLAEAFPQAQTLLGRLLNQKEELRVRPRSGPTSKLSVLSRSFLYQKETARSAVSLLAALANDSARNQRRIVQSVTGVKLARDPSRSGSSHQSTRASSHTLYALTVPADVTNTYRQWRKRQRELQGCRLPNGSPPTRDGVPMPCNCDECLGAEQLLSTWQQHFHDLSRWTRGLEGGEQSEDKRSAEDSVPLSSEAFLRVFLADFHMLTCTVGEAISKREEASSRYASAPYKSPGLIYYFVSPEEAAATPSAAPPHFDPLHHLSAIAIAAEIDVSGERRARIEPERDVIRDENSLSTSLNPPDFSMQEVLLFSGPADIGSCVAHVAGVSADDEARPFPLSDPHESLLDDFVRLGDRYGGLVRCDQLMEHVSDDSIQFHAAQLRHVLAHILSYCHEEDLIPFCDRPLPPLPRPAHPAWKKAHTADEIAQSFGPNLTEKVYACTEDFAFLNQRHIDTQPQLRRVGNA
ncbi:hypothetical protein BBJ28_00001109 [Nothophytophthora sp. Chile5]|nr:hypothetical protein BBJ28_00001109 [Nothophytophthora sp. Chile5]